MAPGIKEIGTNGRSATGSRMDLAMLLPYCIGLMAVTGFHPARLLFPLGVALIAASVLFKNQITIQPMKLVASLAIGTAAVQHGIHPETISTAALLTGLIWLLITAFGLSKTISTWLPRETVTGMNIGVGLYLILTALQLMWDTPYWSAVLFLITSLLLRRQPVVTMLLVTIVGLAMNLHEKSTAIATIPEMKMIWLMPAFQMPMIDTQSVWIAMTLLVLPQLVLTIEHHTSWKEHNQHKLAISTGILNTAAGLFGGAPLDLKSQVGRAPVSIGLVLILIACLFSDVVRVLVERLPDAAVGVILFFAGLQLILGSRLAAQPHTNKIFLVITVLVFLWNAGLAVLLGVVYQLALRKVPKPNT